MPFCETAYLHLEVLTVDIRHSHRLDCFKTGIFAALEQKKAKLIAAGREVYNLSVGTPDFAPAQHIIDALVNAAKDPVNWRYSIVDMPELLEAASDYYLDRFGVKVPTDCITSVHGTQEGMGHLGMALLNKDDLVLLPNPGYPIFQAGSLLGEARIYYYPLVRENNFLPVFSDIPEDVLKEAKYIIVSYPSNPVGGIAPRAMYEELIRVAKKYDIMVINDNAYADIIFDGNEGCSFLSFDGAWDVGVEFLSLSKSFSVTGARISFLAGNKKIVDALKLLRTQIDFGMFYPVQYAAIAALRGPRDSVKYFCSEYQKRRDALCGGLRRIGWNCPAAKGTRFGWAPKPEKFDSCEKFCD
jgi:LL-diaminopimelate aminotransferase